VTRQITLPFGRPPGSSDRTNQVRLAALHPGEGVPICGWIGVEVRPMTRPFADSLGMTEPYGAIFDQPQRSSPAAHANIEAGDVLTAVNGSPLGTWSDFTPTISAMAPGTDVYLTTYRDEQLIEVKVTLGSFECPRH
jgi:serine protease Do